MRKIALLNFLTLISTALNAAPGAYRLEDYVQDIVKNNQGLQALQSSATAGELLSEEGDAVFNLNTYAQAAYLDDERVTTNQGNRTQSNSYEFGFSKQTSFGLAAKLGYSVNSMNIQGVSAAYVPQPEYNDAYLKAEASFSLWRNRFGAEFRGLQEATNYQNKSIGLQNQFQIKRLLTGAKGTYVKVVLFQEQLKIQKDALDRSTKLWEWAKRRGKKQLGNVSDGLQAEAGYRGRKIEYEIGKETLREAVHAFNSLRGIEGDQLSENLQEVNFKELMQLTVPVPMETREDLQASELQSKAAAALAQANVEKNKPTLEVFGQYYTMGRQNELGKAAGDSFSTKNPVKAIGLRLSTPLDFFWMKKMQTGHELEKLAAEQSLQHKKFELTEEWKNLSNRFNEVKLRLNLATEMASLQKKKLGAERTNLSNGRTTTYQVLTFEQDYSNSELMRLQTLAELVGLHIEMQLFSQNKNIN